MERLAVIKKYLPFAVWIFSVYSIIALFYIAVFQIPFPFPLEWIEGPMMDHIIRILDGKPIYTAPSIDFVPSPYTPLYFYISAAFCSIFGISLSVLRTISAISTLSIIITLFLWAKKETSSNTAGIFASGLFASTYMLSSNWFFLARNDMLAVALFMWSAYLLRFSASKRALFYSGILIFLSIMTKQSGLVLATGLFVAGVFIHKKNIIFFALSLFPLLLFSIMLLNELTYGWFWYLTFEMPAHHGVIPTRFLSFFTEDIFQKRLPLFILTVAFIVFTLKTLKKSESLFYFFLTGSILCATYLGRIKVGGAANVFIPFYITGALFTAVLLKIALSKNRILIILVIAISVQLVLAAFNPIRYKPSSKIIKQSKQLLDIVKKSKGDTIILPSGYIAYLAGKSPSAHTCLINDMLSNKERKKEFSEMIFDSFVERKYQTVIVNEKFIPEPLKKNILKNYKKTATKSGIVRWIGSSDGSIETVDVFELKKGK